MESMKQLVLAAFSLLLIQPALAQDVPIPALPSVQPAMPKVAQPMGQVMTAEPQCFIIASDAPYTVFGTVATDYYVGKDGGKTRHQQNFRLDPKQQVRACSTGPFYPGQKLDFIIRTLIPIFTCKISPAGTIMIHGSFKADGRTETTADCDSVKSNLTR
jgi:hypothetical protein